MLKGVLLLAACAGLVVFLFAFMLALTAARSLARSIVTARAELQPSVTEMVSKAQMLASRAAGIARP